MERRSGPQVGHLSPSMDAGVYKGVHTHHRCAQGHYVHGGVLCSSLLSSRTGSLVPFCFMCPMRPVQLTSRAAVQIV